MARWAAARAAIAAAKHAHNIAVMTREYRPLPPAWCKYKIQNTDVKKAFGLESSKESAKVHRGGVPLTHAWWGWEREWERNRSHAEDKEWTSSEEEPGNGNKAISPKNCHG